MLIRELQADHFLIPLPVTLSDSTHGTIRGFELVTVRVRDAEGAEGIGYTYTVGAGGASTRCSGRRTTTSPAASARSR